jgi:hypothetical protein
MAITKRAVLMIAVIGMSLAGCRRGGTTLVGDSAATAPELPREDASWLNGKLDLAAARGSVVLVEAWHPS